MLMRRSAAAAPSRSKAGFWRKAKAAEVCRLWEPLKIAQGGASPVLAAAKPGAVFAFGLISRKGNFHGIVPLCNQPKAAQGRFWQPPNRMQLPVLGCISRKGNFHSCNPVSRLRPGNYRSCNPRRVQGSPAGRGRAPYRTLPDGETQAAVPVFRSLRSPVPRRPGDGRRPALSGEGNQRAPSPGRALGRLSRRQGEDYNLSAGAGLSGGERPGPVPDSPGRRDPGRRSRLSFPSFPIETIPARSEKAAGTIVRPRRPAARQDTHHHHQERKNQS